MDYIYLDHAATTPTHPVVAEKMHSFMTSVFGNPSSVHYFGRKSRHTLDESRRLIAQSINAKENEIVFTSGGTESDNMAVIGAAMANRAKGNHVITSAVEHHAVLHACKYLEKQGFEVTYLPVDEQGRVKIDALEKAIRTETILVSIMYANNEVGTIQPVKEIGELLNGKDIIFHTDAVQAFGALSIDVENLNVDLLSASSHKINGPKGIGFLYVKEGIQLTPLLFGGEQEKKRRAGTENVPGIVGFKHAVELIVKEMESRNHEYVKYKEQMMAIFDNEGISYNINANEAKTLPHVFNIHFPGTNVESLLVNLDLAKVAVSSGSACTAGSIDPSHVLVEMFGKDSDRIKSSIRFSFGLGNTIQQVEKAALETARVVKRLVK